MNKKGLFASLLVAVVIVGCFTVLVNLNNEFKVIAEKIGVYQKPVLQSSADMFLLEEFLKESAFFAFDKSFEDFKYSYFSAPNCNIDVIPFSNSNNSFKSSVCLGVNFSDKAFCSVLNNQNVDYFCRPDFFSGFQFFFDKNFKQYIKKFNSVQNIEVPFDFELSILDDSYFSVISASPVILPITVDNENIGQAVFRPAFKVSSSEVVALKQFSSLFDSLQDVADSCSLLDSVDDVKKCILNTLGEKFCFKVVIKDSLYLFNFDAPFNACFGLYLPLWVAIPSD